MLKCIQKGLIFWLSIISIDQFRQYNIFSLMGLYMIIFSVSKYLWVLTAFPNILISGMPDWIILWLIDFKKLIFINLYFIICAFNQIWNYSSWLSFKIFILKNLLFLIHNVFFIIWFNYSISLFNDHLLIYYIYK